MVPAGNRDLVGDILSFLSFIKFNISWSKLRCVLSSWLCKPTYWGFSLPPLGVPFKGSVFVLRPCRFLLIEQNVSVGLGSPLSFQTKTVYALISGEYLGKKPLHSQRKYIRLGKTRIFKRF